MAGELDDILITEECPRCGATVSATWGQVRVTKAMACGCGTLLRIDTAGSDINIVQALIAEANPPEGEND